MEDNRKKFVAWVEANKVPLAVAGISVGTVLLIALCYGKNKCITELWTYLKKVVKHSPKREPPVASVEKVVTAISKEQVKRSYTSPQAAVKVCGHIRNLPKWQHHSTEKAIEAASKGIELRSNQTLVDGYIKYAA